MLLVASCYGHFATLSVATLMAIVSCYHDYDFHFKNSQDIHFDFKNNRRGLQGSRGQRGLTRGENPG